MYLKFTNNELNSMYTKINLFKVEEIKIRAVVYRLQNCKTADFNVHY